MIRISNIKPIPKRILKRIKALDEQSNPKPNGNTRFYTYYSKLNKDFCSITVAVRNKYKNWYCKQVVIHGIHNDKVLLRDISITMGFIKVGWYRDGISKYQTWHDYDWGYNDDKYFSMTTATIVNKEYILTLPEYKYSAIDKYRYTDIMKYLRFYEKYPQCEYLIKAGLDKYATSKQILVKCSKDKQFCKWLYQNKAEIEQHYYYTITLINAYKLKQPLEEIQKYLQFKKEFSIKSNFTVLKEEFEKDLFKLIKYISIQNTNGYSYTDYLNACNYLGIDMKKDKNRYPHNFQKWHNIRIDEYNTAKALKDKKEKEKLYKQFEQVANKYLSLQKEKSKNYICLIAKSPTDLINEGKILNHCVGSMNYDQKFAREETLIFFVRNKEKPDKPFVTLEYSLSEKKVLQCYGEYDTNPQENVMQYVKKVWLPYANKKLKTLVA